MASEYNEDLNCVEGISVGNFQWGDVVITPQANTRTYIDVTGLNLEGEGDVFIQVSVKSAFPWSSAREVGTSDLNDTHNYNDDPTGFRIWFYRTTAAATRLHWMVWRNPE